MILEQDPGFIAALREAESAEARDRQTPFLGVNLEICTVTVKQFTPRHYEYLMAAESPFLAGGEVAPEDVALFLWVVSTKFCLDERVRDEFIAVIAALKYLPLVEEIRAYLTAVFDERPPSGEITASPITSFSAYLVHEIASRYGWPMEQILDTPFSAIFQFLKLIRREEMARIGKKALFVNRRSHLVRREYAQKLIEKEIIDLELAKRKAPKRKGRK